MREALSSYGELNGGERGEIALLLLTRLGVDDRFAVMRIGFWTTSYLMTAAWLLALFFIAASLWRPHSSTLLIAAGGAIVVASLFGWRARRFMIYGVRAVAYGVLANSSLPEWASNPRERL
jgi:hypothetical protein